MKKNTGRPPIIPVNDRSSVTMKVTAEFKRLVVQQAQAYDMTITEYFQMLVHKDIGS